MRRTRLGRRWSLAEGVIFALASAAILTYLAFDVLDLDESTLVELFAGGMATVEVTQAETERLLEANFWSPHSPSSTLSWLTERIPAVTPRIDPNRLPVILLVHGPLLPRANPVPRGALSDSTPADPA